MKTRISLALMVFRAQLGGSLGCLAVVVLGVALGCRAGELPFKEDYERFRRVNKGMTEKAVREQLGTPQFEYKAGTPPAEFCVKGRACERRAVTGKLLIYIATEPVAYVFIDANGFVEHVYVGGS